MEPQTSLFSPFKILSAVLESRKNYLKVLWQLIFFSVVYSSLVYPIELKIKDTTGTVRSASYLDLHLEINSKGRKRTKLNDKRDEFDFPIVNFPFMSYIPATPALGVYISQLIRYYRACAT